MERETNRKRLEAALSDAGHRLTAQRRAVIAYLAGRTDHPTARQVYQALRSADSTLSLATVYNTLNVLAELGAIRTLEFDSSDNRYDTNTDPHVNLVCSICGTIEDYDHPLPVRFDEILSRVGFHSTDARIEYRGICAACRDQG